MCVMCAFIDTLTDNPLELTQVKKKSLDEVSTMSFKESLLQCQDTSPTIPNNTILTSIVSVHCGHDCRYGTDEAAIYTGKCAGWPVLDKFIAKSDLTTVIYCSFLFIF